MSGVQRYCGNYIASWDSQAIPIDRIWCDVLFLRSVVALKSVLVLIHNHAGRLRCDFRSDNIPEESFYRSVA